MLKNFHFCVLLLWFRIHLLVMPKVSLPEKMTSKWECVFLGAILIWEWELSISRYVLSMMIYFLLQSLDGKWKSITFDNVEFYLIFSEHFLIVYISQAGQEKSNLHVILFLLLLFSSREKKSSTVIFN